MEYFDLDVYQKLFKLALEVHDLTMTFIKYEMFELGSQLRRASNSCLANLAEGFGNKHTNIYTESISRAKGELRETTSHLRMAHAKGYFDQQTLDRFINAYDECSRMLYGLDKSLDSKKR